jgi:hypothetical protein
VILTPRAVCVPQEAPQSAPSSLGAAARSWRVWRAFAGEALGHAGGVVCVGVAAALQLGRDREHEVEGADLYLLAGPQEAEGLGVGARVAELLAAQLRYRALAVFGLFALP